jgi:hypothetical protein
MCTLLCRCAAKQCLGCDNGMGWVLPDRHICVAVLQVDGDCCQHRCKHAQRSTAQHSTAQHGHLGSTQGAAGGGGALHSTVHGDGRARVEPRGRQEHGGGAPVAVLQGACEGRGGGCAGGQHDAWVGYHVDVYLGMCVCTGCTGVHRMQEGTGEPCGACGTHQELYSTGYSP